MKKKAIYPNGHLEEIRNGAMKEPVGPNLITRLQKRLQSKKVKHKSNP